ncbi:MAG: flagellar biosynthetic protein FliO [Gammaproteobacteria bacterium]|nr:MAG: flagellar biosynthetic protein FliO [Gammaproteobacteria bacterium]
MKISIWTFAVLLNLPRTVIAQQAEDAPADTVQLAQSAVNINEMMSVTLGLVAVLIAIFAVAWLMRRFGNFSMAANGELRVVAGMSLGTRERLVLIQVGKEQLLLGVSPGRVQTLHILGEDSRIDIEKSVAGRGTFAEKLAAVMKHGMRAKE